MTDTFISVGFFHSHECEQAQKTESSQGQVALKYESFMEALKLQFNKCPQEAGCSNTWNHTDDHSHSQSLQQNIITAWLKFYLKLFHSQLMPI